MSNTEQRLREKYRSQAGVKASPGGEIYVPVHLAKQMVDEAAGLGLVVGRLEVLEAREGAITRHLDLIWEYSTLEGNWNELVEDSRRSAGSFLDQLPPGSNLLLAIVMHDRAD
jgi:hypothetical protein